MDIIDRIKYKAGVKIQEKEVKPDDDTVQVQLDSVEPKIVCQDYIP